MAELKNGRLAMMAFSGAHIYMFVFRCNVYIYTYASGRLAMMVFSGAHIYICNVYIYTYALAERSAIAYV